MDHLVIAIDLNTEVDLLEEKQRNVVDPFAFLVKGNNSADCRLWETKAFIIKKDIGSPDALLSLHGFGLRLIELSLITGGVVK